MIDTLYRYRSKFKKPQIWDKLNLKKDNYGFNFTGLQMLMKRKFLNL